MALKAGDAAPDFQLPSTSGGDVTLRSLAGKRVVLYFYPADDTPGCTKESCAFRDAYDGWRAKGVEVLGVSKDGLDSHAKFRSKYALPFPLLVDADLAVAKAFGAWGEKTSYGKTTVGLIRSTFLIGKDGKIEASWSPVKVDGHDEQVARAIEKGAPQ